MAVRTLLAITLASLSWRRWSTVGLLLTAATAFAAASVGPLWANASEDSLLQRSVVDTKPSRMTLTLRAYGNDIQLGSSIPALALRDVSLDAGMTPLLDRAFGPTRLALTTATRQSVTVPSRGKTEPTRVLSTLAWVDGGCERLHLTVGRCPEGDGEILLSERTARAVGAVVGRPVSLPLFATEPEEAGSGDPFPTELRLVGVYRRPDTGTPFWAGSSLFDVAPAGLSAQDPVPARTEAGFLTRALMERLAETPVEAVATRRYVPRAPRGDVVDPVQDELARWDAAHQARSGSVRVSNAPLRTMAGVRDERDAVRLASYVLGLQLLMMVWYMLFLLTSTSAESRSHDVALAKLRGLRPRKVAVLGLLEPLAVVTAAVPLGFLLAFVVVRAVAGALLPGSVDLRPDQALAAGLLIAMAGALTAAALGLRRTLRQPVLAQLQRATPATAVGRVLLAEAVVVTAALAALWQVRTREGDEGLDGLALLAPGLAALAVGVIGGRLLHEFARRWTRRTRHSSDVAGFLASRQIGRRTGGTRAAVIVTVTMALAAFAASTWGLVERQRDGQAAMEIGAGRVYRVDAPSPARLLSTVQELDPTGKDLAAAVIYPSTFPSDRVLAVDSRRLAAVSVWQQPWSGSGIAQVARRMRSDTAASLSLIGRDLEVTLDHAVPNGSPDVSLVATVVDRDGREFPVSFGELTVGPQTVTAETEACLRGCRIASFGLVRSQGQLGAMVGRTTFTGLTVDREPVTDPFRSADWRPSRINEDLPLSSTVSTIRRAVDGVEMRFNVTPSLSPGMSRADVPAEVPVVVTAATSLPPVGRDELVMTRGLDGFLVPSRVVERAAVLPRLGGAGVLTDLEIAYRAGPDPVPGLVYQVWASDQAPRGAVLRDRLRMAGLPVTRVETVERRAEALSRTGPALALALLVGVALAALAIAVLALLAVALVQGRRRSYELAALRTAGVSDRVLRRASLREYVVQLGAGTVAGVLCGATTARLLGSSVAGLGRNGTRAPVVDAVEWATLLPVTVVGMVVFVVVAQLCARANVRFADVDLLREAAT